MTWFHLYKVKKSLLLKTQGSLSMENVDTNPEQSSKEICVISIHQRSKFAGKTTVPYQHLEIYADEDREPKPTRGGILGRTDREEGEINCG